MEKGFRKKSPDELEKQVEKANELRKRNGLEEFYPNPEDFDLSEKELKAKYGKQYDEYKDGLKEVIYQRIHGAQSKEELFAAAREILGAEKFPTFQAEMQRAEEKTGKYELSKSKQFAFIIIVSLITSIGAVGLGVKIIDLYATKEYDKRSEVGKNNPIIAEQSEGNQIFLNDHGLVTPEGKRYGAVEQVIAHPDNIKVQGFIDAYSKKIITFEELAQEIKSNGLKGIYTTAHWGDSSTSGWESDIITKNSIEVAKFILQELRKEDTKTGRSDDLKTDDFYKLVLERHPGCDITERSFFTCMTIEAGQLKQHPAYPKVLKEKWSEIGKILKSPFMTYGTYTDKAAQLDPSHHHVNFGVPGYSSVHGKAYIRRMLDELKNADVLQYIDSATIYFGNNDSVNNGNLQDKYFIGDETKKQFAAAGFIKEKLPGIFNATRVNSEDFKQNLESMVKTLRDSGIKQITLFVPVTPYGWEPGSRALADAQESIEKQYKTGGRASQLLDRARDNYTGYQFAVNSDEKNYGAAKKYAKLATENDFMVPRIKEAYIKGEVEVAYKSGINIININQILPIDDMRGINASPKDYKNITNDYCHPGEHANILLAVAQARLNTTNNQQFRETKQRAINELVQIGVPKKIAIKEVEKATSDCIAYSDGKKEGFQRLAHSERTRKTWDDMPE